MNKIAIRFGHTILKNGLCTSAPGIKREYELIREYAPLIISKFQNLGYEVLNVTPSERGFDNEIADINEGIRRANEWGADIFISCHANSYDGVVHGCEVVYSGNNAKGKELANNICIELEKLGYYNRGAKVDVRGLNEITRTHMTSIICEPLFCDSEVDMALYNAENLANAIVKGITGQTLISNINNGWCQIAGTWYFYEGRAKLINSWRKDSNGTWFYVGADGAMVINTWVKDGAAWYYLGINGAMVKIKWVKSNGFWYYLNESGCMEVSKWIKSDDGKQYWVGKDGTMAANTKIDGWIVGADGAWDGKAQIK